MSIKKLLTIVLSVMLVVSAVSFAACVDDGDSSSSGTTEIEYIGFDVPATAEAAYGTTYTLPEFTVTDKDDNVYSVDVEVTCDGVAVAVVAGKIELTELKPYVIKYTIAGTDVSKTLTLTVKDGVKPTVIIGETKAWYFVGEEITLPEVTVTDNLDTNLAYELNVYSGETLVAGNVSGKITLNAQGRYILKATAKDSAGNVGEGQTEIIVRSAAKKGEIVDIDSELIADTVTAWNNNDSSLITKEFVEFKGKKALKINTKGGAEAVKYPGIAIIPAITKAQAEELKASGFGYIAVEYYIDYTAARNLYEKWSGKQNSYATELGKWATRTLPLDSFIENYDALASGTTSFFYLGNDEAWTVDKTRADFDFYVSSIYVCKDVTDVTITGIDDEVAKGYELNVNNLSATSATETEATFSVEVYGADGEKLAANENGIIVLDKSGAYTLKAVSENACYKTTAEKTFKVLSDANEVNALISEILAAEDMSAMTEKAETLKNCYAALTAEEKAKVNAFEYAQAAALCKADDENVLAFFATKLGIEQVSLREGNNAIAGKKGLYYTTDVKYKNEAGSTLFKFESYVAWAYAAGLTLDIPAKSLEGYKYITFAVRGYSPYEARPLTFAVYNNNGRIAPTVTPKDLPTDEWTEFTVAVADLTGTLNFRFWSHNKGDVYGSIDSAKMYAYISNFRLVKEVSDITIGGVETEDLNSGDTLDLTNVTATSSVEGLNYVYSLVYPDGTTTELPESIVLEKGQYKIIATVSGSDLYVGSGELVLNVKVNVEDINNLIAEILGAQDITQMAEKAEELKLAYAALSDDQKSEIDISDYYAAISFNADRNVKFYFAGETGKEQISLAATTGSTTTELTTKKYVTLDTSVKYGNQPASTKIAFADLNEGKETWPCPFIVRLNTPANLDASTRYVRFFLQGYCYNTARPIAFSVTVNGKRIAPNTVPGDAPNGEWKEVLVPVEAFLSGKQVSIVIYTHNGSNNYGSVWNDASRMYVYLSQGEGYNPETEQANDIAFEQTEANLSLVRVYTNDVTTKVDASNYSIDSTVYYGEEETSLKYVTANTSSYAEYINFNKSFDKFAYDSFVIRVMIAESSALAKKTQIGYVINNGATRVIDLRHNFLKVGVWNEIVIPASVIDSVENLNIGFVVNKGGSPFADSVEFYFSDLVAVRNGMLKAEPVAYGTDYSRVYTDTVDGKTATVLDTNNKEGSASNTWKYPGVKVYGLTLNYLNALKKAGYKTMKVEVYVKDGSQATQTVKWGKNGNAVISEINTNKWTEITLDIDALIENFNTYFTDAAYNSAYLFYVDNNLYGSSAAYISLCVGGAYFAK